MSRTKIRNCEFPRSFTTLENFADSSWGNDLYDSVEFHLGWYRLRLWVADEESADREDPDDKRYSVMTVNEYDNPKFNEEVIFECEDPDDLDQWLDDQCVGLDEPLVAAAWGDLERGKPDPEVRRNREKARRWYWANRKKASERIRRYYAGKWSSDANSNA